MTNLNFAVADGSPEPLGVTIGEGGINVAVVSRNATRIDFCLFDTSGSIEIAQVPLPGRTGDVWHGVIAGIGEGARYGLRADGPYQPEAGHRFDPAMLLVDPYAIEIDRPFAYHPDLGRRRIEAHDTAPLMPKGVVRAPPIASQRATPHSVFRPGAKGRSEGLIGAMPSPLGLVYELNVKAFTKLHPSVPGPLRGTVAALAEPDIIAHLQRIGAETIELMPLAAWIDERHLPPLGLGNAWGYNPVTFLAPDPRLAPGGMAEIIRTLDALRTAGIRVILDVVLNHTGEGDDRGSTLTLRGLDNALYYRHEADNPGQPINDTGCGNTLALDRPPVVRLALDALRHWARAGFDGFRFDLAPVMGRLPDGFTPDAPLLRAIAADLELSRLVLIAEPWDVGPGGYQLGNFPAPWAEWNDHYRDDVRRFWRGDAGAASGLATRLTGSSDIFARSGRSPSQSINFIAAHDGFPLADLTAYAQKHNEANGEQNRDGTSDNLSWNCGVEGSTGDPTVRAARHRDARALLATLLLSRGTPMLTAGDEFGRTQGGNNNAYAQDNTTTWLDWAAADDALIALTARLMQLRRRHPLLSRDRFLDGRPAADGEPPDAQWLNSRGEPVADTEWGGTDVLGLALFEAEDRVCLWFNRTRAATVAVLPAPSPGKSWRPVLASIDQSAAIDATRIALPARSVVVWAEELAAT